MDTYLPKLFLVILLLSCLSGCGVGNDVKVVLRYDDFSNDSPTHLEKKILNLLEKYDASITFGVIPNRNGSSALRPNKVAFLSRAVEKGTVEIAQHGYTHQVVVTEPKKSEFAYLEYDHQLERLRKGKELLERVTNLSIRTFIPPRNRWDLNTLRALEATGFDNLSSRVGAGEMPASTSIDFIPGTSNDLSRLRTIVETSTKTPFARGLIVVILHPYDFRGINEKREGIEFSSFRETLDWVSSEKGIPMMSIREASEAGTKFDLGTLKLNKKIHSLLPLIPPVRIPPISYARNFSKIYHTSYSSFATLLLFLIVLYLSFSFISSILSYNICIFLSNLHNILGLAYVFAASLSFLLVFVYSFHDLKAHWLGALCSTTALGISIGAILARLPSD